MIDMQASSFDRISPTALLVAYARQFTDIPYSQELARLVNAQMIVEQRLGEQSEPPVEVVVVLEGRYKAINQVMMQYEATQILEIASGLLPRGMALSQNSHVWYGFGHSVRGDRSGRVTVRILLEFYCNIFN